MSRFIAASGCSLCCRTKPSSKLIKESQGVSRIDAARGTLERTQFRDQKKAAHSAARSLRSTIRAGFHRAV